MLYLRIMKTIRLKLDERSYDIQIGSGIISRLPQIIRSMGFSGPVVIVTDRIVQAKTKILMRPVLNKIPNDVHLITVPASETSKSINIYGEVIHKITKKTRMHRPVIIAFGGGVVGDLAGFVAATYKRGVPLIQVPTTLLAQVDSSIGGKTGIDLAEAKNLVGAFKQPLAVLMDLNFLKSLPCRQIKNGLAEIIKYGIISSRGFFDYLDSNMSKILDLNPRVMEHVVNECASVKAKIVQEDELDVKDVRIVLNFGHTLGHAIESAAGYTSVYNHGESIAIGMVMASEIAFELGMFPEKGLARVKHLIRSAGLDITAKNVPYPKILSALFHDKKFTEGSNRFVLPVRIGAVEIIENIPELLIKNVIKKYVV